ncbi:MAG: hypothetical protein ACRDBH_00625 [Bosea sp. (in: a-proteobacteria)]
MSATYWLSKHLDSFAIRDDAHSWLMALWNAIQVFDDMADGDHPDRENLITAVADTLVFMPANPFFRANMGTLLPLVAVAILKWRAADDAEIAGEPSETSFVWRAGFYDIVLAVVQIVHGFEVAKDAAQHVMNLYGENYADYRKEFIHA